MSEPGTIVTEFELEGREELKKRLRNLRIKNMKNKQELDGFLSRIYG